MSVHKQSWIIAVLARFIQKHCIDEESLYPYFRTWIEHYPAAYGWTKKHCHKCNCPVAFDGAAYCAFCGVSLTVPIAAPSHVKPALPEDDCERHTSGIRTVALEEALAIQRAYAEAVAPPETFTGRLRAAMKPGESPMRTYNRMKRGK